MKRRGFLAFLGLSAGAAAAADFPSPKDGARGFVWREICCNHACRRSLEQFIDVTVPLKVGNQCPSCLWVMPMDGLAEKIKAHNKKYGITPRTAGAV